MYTDLHGNGLGIGDWVNEYVLKEQPYCVCGCRSINKSEWSNWLCIEFWVCMTTITSH